MGRGVRVRAGWGAVAGRRVKLCRGHLQACTLRHRSAVLYCAAQWNEKRITVICEKSHRV